MASARSMKTLVTAFLARPADAAERRRRDRARGVSGLGRPKAAALLVREWHLLSGQRQANLPNASNVSPRGTTCDVEPLVAVVP